MGALTLRRPHGNTRITLTRAGFAGTAWSLIAPGAHHRAYPAKEENTEKVRPF